MLAAVAMAAGLALVLLVGAPPFVLALVASAVALSWNCSAAPTRWHSRGVGELVTAFVVAVLTPCLEFYLQSGYLAVWFLLVLWPLFWLQLAFQLSGSFPGPAADAAMGKRTWSCATPR